MKSVLMSIQPKWCELIANGKKTIEVRKTRPKLETPFKVYIYCTKAKIPIWDNGHIVMYEDDLAITNRWGQGKRVENPCGAMMEGELFLNGKVIGEFVCDKIIDIDYGIEEGVHFDGEYQQGFEINGNGDNPTCLSFIELENYLTENEGYGWHISNLVIYDKPRELSKFITPTDCNSRIAKDMLCNTCCLSSGFCSKKPKRITRPPQSWCYCESEVDSE